MERFEIDLHIWSVFTCSEDLIPLANPKIYIRSKWKPSAWDISLALKLRLWTFHMALELKFRFRPIHHHILLHQRHIIGLIKKNRKLMVVQMGRKRNLGSRALRNFQRRRLSAREISQAGGFHLDLM